MAQLKQPAENLVYSFDFTPRTGGETIAAIDSVDITPRGLVAPVTPLTIAEQAFAGQAVRVRLAGGTDGETYLVTARVTDSSDQLYELDTEFAVIDFGFDVPTVASPYLSAQAFVDRIGIEEATQLTDVGSSGGRIDVPRLKTALADAQAEADGYLAARFAVPLSAVPAIVTTIIFDLAIARLWTANLPEGVKDRRDRAQQQLRDIAKGIITLPGAATIDAAPASPTPVLFQANERLFTRDTMGGF